MTIKYLIDLRTFSDVRALDAMFWHEHGFEVVDDLDEPIVAKHGMREVSGGPCGCQNAANGDGPETRNPYVYGRGGARNDNSLK